MRQKFSLSIVIGVTALLLMLTLGLGGGLILAPYLNSAARAAAVLEANTITRPSAQLPADDTDIVVAYEQALINVYQQTLPSVVNIQVTQKTEHPTSRDNPDFHFNPFDFDRDSPEEFYNRGQGSGFVWDNEGHIVTNYHVIAEATDVQVIFADGATAKAEVLGSDPDSDLAILKVEQSRANLQPVTLGDSDILQVGQLAIAIGNPFGQDFSMTSGIISAMGRIIRSGNSPFSIPEVIQTDAPINPGNSGGPLFNRQGEVIGINTQIISNNGASVGIGFAVPINIAKRVVPTLIKGETYEYAWLGISGITLTPEMADLMKLPTSTTTGALVLDVAKDGPADEVGLQGSDKTLRVDGVEYQFGGDVITAINDQPVTGMDDLIAYLIEEARPGDEVKFMVIRPDGEQETVDVTLSVRPSRAFIDLRSK